MDNVIRRTSFLYDPDSTSFSALPRQYCSLRERDRMRSNELPSSNQHQPECEGELNGEYRFLVLFGR